MANGLTEGETTASASVAGLSPTAPPEAAALPVVGYGLPNMVLFASVYEHGHGQSPGCDVPLVRLSDAQAALDTLAAEVGRLTGELAATAANRDAWSTACHEAVREARDWRAQHHALKAALPDADAVMRLADVYAEKQYLSQRFGGHYSDDRDAAREKLRSALRDSHE